MRPKRSRVYDLCPPHHSFILQSPRNNVLYFDMSNMSQLQPSWRWPLWQYRSPQDVSAGHGQCHGDHPWQFPNDVIVWGTKIIQRSVKLIGNEKERWVSHYCVVYKLNLISMWVEFLIGQFIMEVNISIQLGHLRWVPTAYCAGRRGLTLLTVVRPVELALCYRSNLFWPIDIQSSVAVMESGKWAVEIEII